MMDISSLWLKLGSYLHIGVLDEYEHDLPRGIQAALSEFSTDELMALKNFIQETLSAESSNGKLVTIWESSGSGFWVHQNEIRQFYNGLLDIITRYI